MTSIDIAFTRSEIHMFQSMVGNEFIKFRSNPYTHFNRTWETIGIFTDKSIYRLQNSLDVIDYFGAPEDVCAMHCFSAKECDIESGLVGVKLIDTPVHHKIQEIQIINECQMMMYKNAQLCYELRLPRGIIFLLDNDTELSFDKIDTFVELIGINMGHNTLSKFWSLADIVEPFDPPFTAEASRTMLILDGKTITEKPLETARTPQKE